MVTPPPSPYLLSVVCRDGAGEGQGWPLAGVGREAEPEPRWQAQGRPSPLLLRSLAQEPHFPAPATCPASQSQDSLSPAGLETTPPAPSKPGGILPPQTAVETTSPRLCSAWAGREREGRPGKGKIQVAAPAQPSPSPSRTQGQGHRPFSWLDGAWEKNLRFLSLRVKMTQEQPCGEMGGTPGGQLERDHVPAQGFGLRAMGRGPFWG